MVPIDAAMGCAEIAEGAGTLFPAR
jgi:hypothetical protein